MLHFFATGAHTARRILRSFRVYDMLLMCDYLRHVFRMVDPQFILDAFSKGAEVFYNCLPYNDTRDDSRQ